MNWLSKLFGNEPEEFISVVQCDSVEDGVNALNQLYPEDEYEEVREKEYYCGICGWVPCSQFHTHGH